MLYRKLVVQGCGDILQWWRDHRLEFPALSDIAINTFCVMATSAANEQVFSMAVRVVNGRRTNLKRSSLNVFVIQKTFFWLWIEPTNELLPAMKHVFALVF